MTRSEAKVLLSNLDVLKAYAEGQHIQYRHGGDPDSVWRDAQAPAFNTPLVDYRIKPRPIEGWVNVYEDGSMGVLHGTKTRAAEAGSTSPRRIIFVREVEI